MTQTIIQRFANIILLCFIAILSTHAYAENTATSIKEWTILVYNFEDQSSRDLETILVIN